MSRDFLAIKSRINYNLGDSWWITFAFIISDWIADDLSLANVYTYNIIVIHRYTYIIFIAYIINSIVINIFEFFFIVNSLVHIEDIDNLTSRVRIVISDVILISSMVLLVLTNRYRRSKFTIIDAADRYAYLCPKNKRYNIKNITLLN